jgi:hypothetical protein
MQWLLSTRIGRALSWASVAALAAFGIYAAGRREGRSAANSDAMEQDYENADDIRRRVSTDRAKRLRELDDAGWRD